MWNPETLDEESDEDSREGVKSDDEASDDESSGGHFMFFTEIAAKVAPIIDELFPVDSGVRIVRFCCVFLLAEQHIVLLFPKLTHFHLLLLADWRTWPLLWYVCCLFVELSSSSRCLATRFCTFVWCAGSHNSTHLCSFHQLRLARRFAALSFLCAQTRSMPTLSRPPFLTKKRRWR